MALQISHSLSLLSRCFSQNLPIVLRNVRLLSSNPVDPALDSKSSSKSVKISRAMREYVKKAEEYASLIENEQSEFELGKRHLANIMGVDAECLTQQQIDSSISYLLPSGLFEPRARPVMKPPEDIFPKRKPAQFGVDGRPYHFLFYSGKPNYYELLNEGAFWLMKLNDASARSQSEKFSRIDLSGTNSLLTYKFCVHSFNCIIGSDWIDVSSLRYLTLENVDDDDHRVLVNLLSRIADLPNSKKAEKFLFKFVILMISIFFI